MLRRLLLLTFALCLAGFSSAQTVTERVVFPQEDLSLIEVEGYTQVYLRGMGSTFEVGAPMLPLTSASLVVPQEMRAKGVVVDDVVAVELDGEYRVFPVQPPQPLSDTELVYWVPPNDAIYGSSTPYPDKLARAAHQGSMAGYNIVSLLVAPVQYYPASRRLVFYKEIQLSLELEPAESNALRTGRRSEETKQRIEKIVKRYVINPEDVERFAPSEK